MWNIIPRALLQFALSCAQVGLNDNKALRINSLERQQYAQYMHNATTSKGAVKHIDLNQN